MRDRLVFLQIVLFLVVWVNGTGCLAVAPEKSQNQSTKIEKEQKNLVTLSGVVLHKKAVKNAETWMAGGSDYYVLDVGNAQIQERSATEGVILRSSETVAFESFVEYVGKRVEVTGYYVAAQPYKPQNPLESYPTDMDGKPLPTGAGFKVDRIKVIGDRPSPS